MEALDERPAFEGVCTLSQVSNSTAISGCPCNASAVESIARGSPGPTYLGAGGNSPHIAAFGPELTGAFVGTCVEPPVPDTLEAAAACGR